MSHRSKLLVFALAGFGAFYLFGLRETRAFESISGRHGAIALSSAVHLLACVLGVVVTRVDRFSASPYRQFFLVLGAAVALALGLVGFRALLSQNPVLVVLLDGLPKLALLVPLMWIGQQEKLTRRPV